MTAYFIKRLADYSEETLIIEMKRVASIITNQKITTTEYNKHSKVSAATIQRKFGGWEKALIKSGIGHRYGGRVISEKNRQHSGKGISREACLEEIKVIVQKLNKETITHKEFNNNSSFGAGVVVKRFGSWDAALKAAGVLKSKRMNISESDLFENILIAWTHYGRQPKKIEMNSKPSTIHGSTYEGRFGSWIKALNAFEIFVNSTQQENEEGKSIDSENNLEQRQKADLGIKTRPEDKHSIPIGLRYQVFVKDRFRSVKCGRNPATELINITLHADHIIPFSKGGKTVIDNLQTTCSDCNLGKGNRHNE